MCELKLRKITQKLCKSCKYHTIMGLGQRDAYCFYCVYMEHSRTDHHGYCDVYEEGTPKRLIDWNGHGRFTDG